MSLDKWIKSDKEKNEKKSKSQKSKGSEAKTKEESSINTEPGKKLLKKFQLNCSKKSCNYQKTVMKRLLNDKDLICPRCEGKMKIKEI